MIAEAKELLDDIRKLRKAQVGDSGDAELDAANDVIASALAVLRKVSERYVYVANLLDVFDAEPEPEPEEDSDED